MGYRKVNLFIVNVLNHIHVNHAKQKCLMLLWKDFTRNFTRDSILIYEFVHVFA